MNPEKMHWLHEVEQRETETADLFMAIAANAGNTSTPEGIMRSAVMKHLRELEQCGCPGCDLVYRMSWLGYSKVIDFDDGPYGDLMRSAPDAGEIRSYSWMSAPGNRWFAPWETTASELTARLANSSSDADSATGESTP